MALAITDTRHYSDIADAIRARAGTEDTYLPSEMAAAIAALPSGGGGLTREGTAYAVLSASGELVLFRSARSYEPGAGQTVTDVLGNAYRGTVYAGVEDTGDTPPWDGERDDIVSVRVAADQAVAPATCREWFVECGGLVCADLSGLDTSGATSLMSMFTNCAALASLDASPLDTSSVTEMSFAFSGCDALVSLDLSGWDTSSATGMYNMLGPCGSLERVTLGPSWARVLGSRELPLFDWCSSLAAIVVGREAPPDLSEGAYMFDGATAGSLGYSPRTLRIYVPDASVAAYRAADGWSAWASIILPMSDLPAWG